MRDFLPRLLAGALVAFASLTSSAAVLQGRLDDTSNNALHGSDLGTASFTDVYAVANNVALYEISVDVEGETSFVSSGYALGGPDPYFTLFRGIGGAATFVASNFEQAFSSGGDFAFSALLPAGEYTVALGAFANMSFAENVGTGSLGDGFTALGGAEALRNMGYSLLVTVPAVPEPGPTLLLALGLTGMFFRVRQRLRTRLPNRPDASLSAT